MPRAAAKPMAAACLTPAEVAARLKVTDDHVIGLIHSGRLAAANVALGRKPRWRVTPEALDVFLRAQTPAAKQTDRRRRKRADGVIEFFK